MTKYIFSICFFALSFGMQAQYNLQLNQVILVGNTTQTVPAGKVWKVESYMQSGITITEMTEFGTACNFPGRHHPMIVNNQPYYLINGSPGHGSSGTYMAVGNSLPMWLPANSTLRSACATDVISVLEFNLVP
jgi:hypothetical protein